MKIKQFLFIISTILLITACGSSGNNRSLKDYLSAYLSENNEVVAFGNANLKNILDKADYKSIDKVGSILDGELDNLKEVLNLDSPLYYATEGPFTVEGSPKSTSLFIEVLNMSELKSKFLEMGYDLDESSKGFSYGEDGDFCFGLKDNLAVIYIRGGEFKVEEELALILEKSQGSVSEGRVKDILDSEGDIVSGVSIANLYGSSNTDLAKLPEEQKEELTKIFEDGYVQMNCSFDDGGATITINNLFSKELLEKIFLGTNNDGAIYNRVNAGNGHALMGVSVNLDVEKLEEFAKTYAEDALNENLEVLGLDNNIFGMFGSGGVLKNITDGHMAVALTGNPDEYSFGVNSYVGASKLGQMAFMGYKENLALPFDLDYEYKDGGIYGSMALSGEGAAEDQEELPLPVGCEGFGKSGITAFLNLQEIDVTEFELQGELKLLEIVKYATFEFNAEGGKLYIKANEGKENILKQAVESMMDDLMDQINDIRI
ncbi:MAG: hypothetical protein MK066_10120 [Crocinitomicaceae bacterium]|nr:hypothetical protein [Crocinitomicaceae bacterium]